MKSLHMIGLGLLLVILDVGAFDVVPDVVGWLFVMAALVDERRRFPTPGLLLGLAALATVVSGLLTWPDLLEPTELSVQWALSLPQIAFSYALCTAMTRYLPGDAVQTRRFAGLRFVYVVVALLPVVVLGGGVEVMLVPAAITATVADLYLIWLLFRSASLAESRAITLSGGSDHG